MTHSWDDVAHATAALIDTVESLPEGAQFEPSLCAGWTRGHVLTHLARNAEALGQPRDVGRHEGRDADARQRRGSQ